MALLRTRFFCVPGAPTRGLQCYFWWVTRDDPKPFTVRSWAELQGALRGPLTREYSVKNLLVFSKTRGVCVRLHRNVHKRGGGAVILEARASENDGLPAFPGKRIHLCVGRSFHLGAPFVRQDLRCESRYAVSPRCLTEHAWHAGSIQFLSLVCGLKTGEARSKAGTHFTFWAAGRLWWANYGVMRPGA